MEVLIIIALGLALYWLMFETNWLRVRLPLHIPVFNIRDTMMMGIAMVFIAIGLCMLRITHEPFPAVLVSPKGERFKGYTLNQARHICKRVGGWIYELETVMLVSPNGTHYYHFNGLQAERISQKQPGWRWEAIN